MLSVISAEEKKLNSRIAKLREYLHNHEEKFERI